MVSTFHSILLGSAFTLSLALIMASTVDATTTPVFQRLFASELPSPSHSKSTFNPQSGSATAGGSVESYYCNDNTYQNDCDGYGGYYSDNGIGTRAIIGIILGCFWFVVLICCCSYCMMSDNSYYRRVYRQKGGPAGPVYATTYVVDPDTGMSQPVGEEMVAPGQAQPQYAVATTV